MKKFNNTFTRIIIISAFGCLLIFCAGRYIPVQTGAQPVSETAAQAPTDKVSGYGDSFISRFRERLAVLSAKSPAPKQESAKEEYVPSVLRYNLVNLFPEEEAKEEPEPDGNGPEIFDDLIKTLYAKLNLPVKADVKKSYGGQMYELLNKMDADWASGMYQWIQATPEQAVRRLNRSSSTALGRYNPVSPLHKAEDPGSWFVPSWKNITINVLNGDGGRTDLYSNSCEIASMASVNTYYTGWQDVEQFKRYIESLWKASHSYSVSVSDVYYCDGCVDPLAAAADNANEAGNGTLPAKTEENPSQSENGGKTASDASQKPSPTETSPTETSPAESSPVESSPVESVPAESAPTESGSSAAKFMGPASDSNLGMPVTTAVPGSEMAEENGPADASAAATSAVDGTTAAGETAAALPELQLNSEGKFCPGHMDLTITARIIGLSEKKNLFTADKMQGQNGVKEWTPYQKAYVQQLALQNWEEEYGLSPMDLALGKPLTSIEISNYLSALPANTSQKRRTVIAYALNSVGKIPYYYGGKPSATGYENNRFSSLTVPDQKGRVLSGLDCSGWINWIYWSAIGERPGALGTGGLISEGRSIRREELKPGDIIVKPGLNSHVVMFMNWAPNGSMICIHETGSSINNVTVSTLDAHWPYYRALLE